MEEKFNEHMLQAIRLLQDEMQNVTGQIMVLKEIHRIASERKEALQAMVDEPPLPEKMPDDGYKRFSMDGGTVYQTRIPSTAVEEIAHVIRHLTYESRGTKFSALEIVRASRVLGLFPELHSVRECVRRMGEETDLIVTKTRDGRPGLYISR